MVLYLGGPQRSDPLKSYWGPKIALGFFLVFLALTVITFFALIMPELKKEVTLISKIIFSFFYNFSLIFLGIYIFRNAKYSEGIRRIKFFGIISFSLSTIPFLLDLILGNFMDRWSVLTILSPFFGFVFGFWISLAKEWKGITIEEKIKTK